MRHPGPSCLPDTEERTAALERRSTSASWCSTAPPAPRSRRSTSPPTTSAAPSSRAATRTSAPPGPTSSTRVHERYLAAGCDIVETNTFGAHAAGARRVRPRRPRLRAQPRASARIAREACARYDTPGRLRFVCGSMGPTTKAISVTGGVTFEELQRALPRPGPRPDGRRRRLPAARDLPGHAQRQGRPARHRAGVRRRPAGGSRSRSR